MIFCNGGNGTQFPYKIIMILYCTQLTYTILSYHILYCTILHYSMLYYGGCTMVRSVVMQWWRWHPNPFHSTLLYYKVLCFVMVEMTPNPSQEGGGGIPSHYIIFLYGIVFHIHHSHNIHHWQIYSSISQQCMPYYSTV